MSVPRRGLAVRRRIHAPSFVTVFGGAALACFVALDPLSAVLGAVLAAAVLWVVAEDLAAFCIPDFALVVIALAGLAWALLHANGRPLGEVAVGTLVRGTLVLCLFAILAWLYRRWRAREGLGFGDVKLLGAGAVLLEPASLAVALTIATLAALLAAHRRAARRKRAVRAVTTLPFGAFLAPSLWITWLAGAVGLSVTG